MPIGSARSGAAKRSLWMCFSALVCMLGSPAWPDDAAPSVLGRWRKSDERPGRPPDGSFSRLEFLPRGKVVGLRFMAGVFSSGGEVLESGYGRYRLRGSTLSITPPKRTEADGWPGTGELHGSTYRCGITIDARSMSLMLSNCPLSGTWTREAKSGDAPEQ